MNAAIAVIVILATLNIFLLRKYLKYKSKTKQEGLFGKWPIPQVSVDQLSPDFETNQFGPTLKSEVYFIGRGNLNVPGGTSDAEAWILSVLAKKAKNIFEIGTCTGKTTYLFARNSPPDATVTTITLSPEQLNEYKKGQADNEKSTEDAVSESAFNNFLYSDTPEEKKIIQLFGDSKQLNVDPYRGKMDLIFVDGSHAYSYVLNDSEKALSMIAPNGIILWHDYRGPFDTIDVFKALNKLAAGKKLVHIKGTSLVAYKAPAG
jgi:hypothetical protein